MTDLPPPGQQGWAPPPVPAGEPAAEPAGPTLQDHLRRARSWRIGTATPAPKERVALAAAGVDDPLLASYLVWRRSMLVVTMPVILLTGLGALLSLAEIEFGEPFNQLGDIAAALPSLAPLVLVGAVALSLASWTDARRSSRILVVGWVISFVMPLIPAVLPLEFLVDTEELEFQIGDPDTAAAFITGLKLVLGIGYAMQLLPAIVTFPAGAVRGALRVRGLLPASPLTGWMLIVAAPFYSVLTFVALVLITQLLGTGLLLVGTLLLVCGPWVHVWRRRLYTGISTAESEAELDKTQNVTGTIALAGFAVILVWALTAKVSGLRPIGSGEDATLNYVDGGRLAIEAVARVLLSTVVFTSILLRMTLTDWRNSTIRRSQPGAADVDAQFARLETALGRDDAG